MTTFISHIGVSHKINFLSVENQIFDSSGHCFRHTSRPSQLDSGSPDMANHDRARMWVGVPLALFHHITGRPLLPLLLQLLSVCHTRTVRCQSPITPMKVASARGHCSRFMIVGVSSPPRLRLAGRYDLTLGNPDPWIGVEWARPSKSRTPTAVNVTK